MTWLESFLADKFTQMPLAVRVFTYLLVLLLFAYLLLLPRFINGEVVFKTKSGGYIPYRGADIKTLVDGRALKFKTNQDGVWSIPIVSRLPKSISVWVYLEDESAWFELNLKPTDFWLQDLVRVQVIPDPPSLSIASSNKNSGLTSSAWANHFYLTSSTNDVRGPSGTGDTLSSKVYSVISNVTDTNLKLVDRNFVLIGKTRPNYVQRIQIIAELEKHFDLRIPDEEWKYFSTAGQLVDYIEQNIKLVVKATLLVKRGRDWLPVVNDHVVRVGENFQFQIISNQDGYLYIFDESSTGVLQLWPPPYVPPKARIKAHAAMIVPDEGRYEFSEPIGKEIFYILVSPKPINFEEIISSFKFGDELQAIADNSVRQDPGTRGSGYPKATAAAAGKNSTPTAIRLQVEVIK